MTKEEANTLLTERWGTRCRKFDISCDTCRAWDDFDNYWYMMEEIRLWMTESPPSLMKSKTSKPG